GREALRRKAADGFGARLDRGGDDLGIELEWLGDREYLTMGYYGEGGTWTDALLHAFEPAVEGIGVELRGKRGWTRPSEVVTLNYSPDLALTAAERGAGLRHLHKMRFPREIRYFRFWAYHLWQPADRVPPVRLVRGSTLVSPLTMNDAASARGRIDAAIDRMGSYLQYRQNPGGGFSHEFVPGADRYGTGNSARVQLQALEGLATYAAWRGKPDVIEGARRGIDAFRKYLVPMTRRIVNEAGESVEQSAGRILVLPGHGNHLDITARLLGAMLILSPVQSRTAEGTKEEAQTRDELIAALLSAQTDEGRFAIVLDSEAENRVRSATPASLDLGSGPALLTLARVGSGPGEALSQSKPAGPGTRTLAERIDRSIMRALTFYRRANRPTPAPTAASFLARGFAIHYANTNDARLSDFVFEITDRLIRLQLHEGVCRYPELFGAINVREPGLVGADTAIYLTTLAEALLLARRVGDTDRIRRYQAATLSAVRFLLQLEVREIDCYAIRSPRDALKGVRTSPWNARIRVDHCANTVVALIRARAALFGERERPTAGGSR
ncbi:MAG: hypothetical protein ACE5EC_07660, partial [Phycisphaerae bacterium]